MLANVNTFACKCYHFWRLVTFIIHMRLFTFVCLDLKCATWSGMKCEQLPSNVNHNMTLCDTKCEHMLANVNTLCNEICKTVVIKLCLMSRANLIQNLGNWKTATLLPSSFARNCTLQKFQVNMRTCSYSKYEPLYLLCHQMWSNANIKSELMPTCLNIKSWPIFEGKGNYKSWPIFERNLFNRGRLPKQRPMCLLGTCRILNLVQRIIHRSGWCWCFLSALGYEEIFVLALHSV